MAEEMSGGQHVEIAPPQKPKGDGGLSERLRLHASGYVPHYPWEWAEDAAPLLLKAADEIERLRSLVRFQDRVIRSGDTACLTQAEREAIRFFSLIDGPGNVPVANKRAATLRGLLERLGSGGEVAPTAKSDAPPQPSPKPWWMGLPYWVDPPSGWRYGFPKLYDPAKDGPMREWMIAQGYPQALADKGLNCTFTAATQEEGDANA